MRTLSACLLLALMVGCNQAELDSTVPVTKTSIIADDDFVAHGAAGETAPEEFNAENLPTAEYDVPGLHCVSCSESACGLLLNMDGVKEVKADAHAKKVFVVYEEGNFDSDAAKAALDEQFVMEDMSDMAEPEATESTDTPDEPTETPAEEPAGE